MKDDLFQNSVHLEVLDDEDSQLGRDNLAEKSATKDRPLKCLMCGKGLQNLANLHNHMINRTDAKPYDCKNCDVNPTTSNELMRHVKQEHTPREE